MAKSNAERQAAFRLRRRILSALEFREAMRLGAHLGLVEVDSMTDEEVSALQVVVSKAVRDEFDAFPPIGQG